MLTNGAGLDPDCWFRKVACRSCHCLRARHCYRLRARGPPTDMNRCVSIIATNTMVFSLLVCPAVHPSNPVVLNESYWKYGRLYRYFE